MVKVRFAPSPTGYLHIGNMRAAIFNYLFALKMGGDFVLRYDDTDLARSQQKYIDAILEDITWLGLKPSEIAFQSRNFAAYDAAAEKLKSMGLLYPCYETAEELDMRRKIRASRKLPPIYGREALRLTDEQKQAYEQEGRKPHWRFLLPNFKDDPHNIERSLVEWVDLVRGPQSVDLASLSDPILIREDGTYLYTLPSVVDDISMQITHVIRGDDHIINTGAQLPIFAALGASLPQFGHLNLLTTVDGEGLSKRSGSLSIRTLREDGIEPMAICSLAVLIGTSKNIVVQPDMVALSKEVSIEDTSKSLAKFNSDELLLLNAQLVQKMDYSAVKDRLSALGVPDSIAEDFWAAVSENIKRVVDSKDWLQVVCGDISLDGVTFTAEQKDLLKVALDLLPPAPWDDTSWKSWTGLVQKATGKKGKDLFMPLRLALTGVMHGPDLKKLLPLIGFDKAVKRLQMAVAG